MGVSAKNIAIAAAALLFSVSASYAQVCKESNATSNSGRANLDCDMTYRNAVITCDIPADPNTHVRGTDPSCPAKPMPMIDTPKKSYIADYSPYLFAYPRDDKDNTRPYSGVYSTGTPGDASKTYQLFGNDAPGAKRSASCEAQIKLPSDTLTTAADEAKFVRLQADNCTNEYILNSALYPYQKENVTVFSGDDPANPGRLRDLKSDCQPLKTYRETTNEYSASTYLQAAWQKTLVDPTYRKTTVSKFRCVACTNDPNVPCDREPHLPCGTTLEKTVAAPNPFPEVLLSSISTVPYEEINDPTHPFSPRWDFRLTERDYSKRAASWQGVGELSSVATNYALQQTYLTDPTDTVFCAGIKKAQNESDAKKKKDLEVPVDVLEFRRPAFEEALFRRVNYNATCFANQPPFGGQWVPGPKAIPLSYCFRIRPSSSPPYFETAGIGCWECFGLTKNQKVDDEEKHPPCTANYLGKDLRIVGENIAGGLNLFSWRAQCNYFLKARDSKYNMDTVCRDLRKPYTPMNKLKMRYHYPDDPDDAEKKNVVLKDGALEGFTFKEYFGNHMPYPALWDIGHSLQKTSSADVNSQPPLDTIGQYTAIVGIGREAAATSASDNAPANADGKKAAELFPEQRCKAMGWGSTTSTTTTNRNVSFGGVSVSIPDPMSSWTEFKLYQARTTRQLGLSCIGRYEKVFKSGSAENLLMLASGAEWSKVVISKCPKTTDGTNSKCTYMSLKEYTDAGSPESDNTTLYLKQIENQAIPSSWRGYLASTTDDKFPLFGGAASEYTGLDSAELGDIIMMPNGPSDSTETTKRGLAKLAMVIEVNNKNCSDKKNCYVKVMEPDNGKWPDSCGSTDSWGEMKTRYYFKPGSLPDLAKDEYTKIKAKSDCEETRLSHCEMSAWNRLKIYRVRSDTREGCDKIDTATCKDDEGGESE